LNDFVDVISVPQAADKAKAAAIWNVLGPGGYSMGGRQANLATGAQADGVLNGLYAIGDRIVGVSMMAIAANDLVLLESVATSYTHILAQRTMFTEASSGTVINTWLESTGEIPLSTAQFLHPVARILAHVAKIPAASRVGWMNTYISNWMPVLRDHVELWTFRKSWGPAGQCQNISLPPYGTSIVGHEQRLARLAATSVLPIQNTYPQSVRHCNNVFDTEQLLMGTAAEYYLAHLNDPLAVPLPATRTVADFQRYLSVANASVRAHSSTVPLTDFSGNPKTGRIYDLEGNNTLGADNNWAYDFDESLPPHCTPVRAVKYGPMSPPMDSSTAQPGEDILHFRRWPSVAFSLRAATARGNISNGIPRSEMIEYANNLLYGYSNKAFGPGSYPKWKNRENYNGWYRTGYSGGDGYGPWQAGTVGVVTGRFGFWSIYNSELKSQMMRMKEILEATSGPDYNWRLENMSSAQPWIACVKQNTSINVGPYATDTMLSFYSSL
jgi:hypothetical protein